MVTIKRNLKTTMAKYKFLNVAEDLCFQNITAKFFKFNHKNIKTKLIHKPVKSLLPRKIINSHNNLTASASALFEKMAPTARGYLKSSSGAV